MPPAAGAHGLGGGAGLDVGDGDVEVLGEVGEPGVCVLGGKGGGRAGGKGGLGGSRRSAACAESRAMWCAGGGAAWGAVLWTA